MRNAWAFHRTRGPVCKRGRKDAHELLTNAAPRLRSARGGFFGLLNAPRRRRYRRLHPVRANCRPDTHLDRSPVLPASVPPTSRVLPLTSKDRHRGGHRIPLRDRKTVRTRPHIGAGRCKEYSYDMGKSISERAKIEEGCQQICRKFGLPLENKGKLAGEQWGLRGKFIGEGGNADHAAVESHSLSSAALQGHIIRPAGFNSASGIPT